MRRTQRRYVRQMPKIYGNLQREPRSWEGLGQLAKAAAVMIGVVLLVYGVFFSPLFKVRKVEISGTELTSEDTFRALVPLGHNIWTLSKASIVQGALNQPLVLSVGIYRGIPDTVRVVIQEKTPLAVWYSGSSVTLLDEDGYSFAQFTQDNQPRPDSAAGKRMASIPHIRDTKALPVALNKRVASPTFLTFIQKVENELAQNLPEVHLDSIEIADTTYDVTFVAKEGLRVQMDSQGDAGVQVRNLTRLIRQNKATLASQVDLRIDRWAYVQ